MFAIIISLAISLSKILIYIPRNQELYNLIISAKPNITKEKEIANTSHFYKWEWVFINNSLLFKTDWFSNVKKKLERLDSI